MTVVKFIV